MNYQNLHHQTEYILNLMLPFFQIRTTKTLKHYFEWRIWQDKNTHVSLTSIFEFVSK